MHPLLVHSPNVLVPPFMFEFAFRQFFLEFKGDTLFSVLDASFSTRRDICVPQFLDNCSLNFAMAFDDLKVIYVLGGAIWFGCCGWFFGGGSHFTTFQTNKGCELVLVHVGPHFVTTFWNSSSDDKTRLLIGFKHRRGASFGEHAHFRTFLWSCFELF